MSENQNKLYKDIVLEVDIDAKKGAKNQVIETHATFYSYDIQSGLIKINIKKDNKSLPLPNGTQVLLSVVKLDLPQQKMVFTGDIVDSTEGIVHWVIPDELQGYKGTIRTGVFVKLPNDQRLHGGYFKFHMGISEIDENLEPFEENYWQGWHDFQQEAEQEWNAWKASRDKTWKEHEEAYNKWKKQQENKQKRYENDTDERWNNWKNQQEKAQSDFESNFVSWKSAQENKQKQFESDFQSWKDTQVNKQAEFEDSTNEQLKGITEDVNNAEDKVVDLEKNLDVEQKNYFSMTAWENNASTDVVDNDLPAVKLKLEGNTQYTLSTNIPMHDESSDKNSVFFATSNVGRVYSHINGVAIDKPRTITTHDDGVVIVAIWDKDITSGDWWIMLNKGKTASKWIPNAEDLATKQELDKKLEDKADKTDLAGKVLNGKPEFITPKKTFENLHQEDTESNRSTWLQIVVQGSIGFIFGTVKNTVDLKSGFYSTICIIPKKYKIITGVTKFFAGNYGKSGSLKILNSADPESPNKVEIYRFKDDNGLLDAPVGERFDIFGAFIIDPDQEGS